MLKVLFLNRDCISLSLAACQRWESGPERASSRVLGSIGEYIGV